MQDVDKQCEQLVTIAVTQGDAISQPTEVNRVVFRQLARELTELAAGGGSKAQLWAVVYDKDSTSVRMEYHQELAQELSPGGWAVWGDRALDGIFPRLTRSVVRHRGATIETPHYLGLYYFLSAALGMWDRTFGKGYPSLKYWWRMEPDMLFSGSFGAFIRLTTEQTVADCVLSGPFISQRQMLQYPHWQLNPDALANTPEESRLWSIMAIGRYSRHMMDLLGASWDAGLMGYEEITVPMTCLTSPSCTLSQFMVPGKIGGELMSRNKVYQQWPKEPNAAYGDGYSSRVRFRPDWDCQDYLASRQSGSLELWHPVKNRTCLAEQLLGYPPSTQARSSAAPAASGAAPTPITAAALHVHPTHPIEYPGHAHPAALAAEPLVPDYGLDVQALFGDRW